MADEYKNHIARYVRDALIVLAVIFVVLLVFLIIEYHALRQQQNIDMHELRATQLLQRHAPLPVSDAGDIRTWMTFDYINRLFALPTDYLKTQLQITDARYPRLTIGEDAESVHVDQGTLLGNVEGAIRDYVPVKNATST